MHVKFQRLLNFDECSYRLPDRLHMRTDFQLQITDLTLSLYKDVQYTNFKHSNFLFEVCLKCVVRLVRLTLLITTQRAWLINVSCAATNYDQVTRVTHVSNIVLVIYKQTYWPLTTMYLIFHFRQFKSNETNRQQLFRIESWQTIVTLVLLQSCFATIITSFIAKYAMQTIIVIKLNNP